MKTLLNTVNYDYPHCGGIVVTEAVHGAVLIEEHSNVTGNTTGRKIRVLGKRADTVKTLIRVGASDADVLSYAWSGPFDLIRKGHKVQ